MLGKLLIAVGLLIATAGALITLFPMATGWLGRLPGDIRVERPGMRFYFPLGTSILLSVLLSAVLYLISRFL